MAKDNQGGPGSRASRASPESEGFLGRWSRRKAEAKLPAAVADLPVAEADLQAADAELQAAETELPAAKTELPAADAEQTNQLPAVVLPDIDKMGAGSDFSVFMQAGVPSSLKTKALRKLWRVKPELANLDGLLDYGEDLTSSFKVVDHLKTAYEVGKGFLRDKIEDEPIENKPTEDVTEVQDNIAGTTVTAKSAIEDDEAEPAEIDRTTDERKPLQNVIQARTPKAKLPKG